jgi:hypothetical protein
MLKRKLFDKATEEQEVSVDQQNEQAAKMRTWR